MFIILMRAKRKRKAMKVHMKGTNLLMRVTKEEESKKWRDIK